MNVDDDDFKNHCDDTDDQRAWRSRQKEEIERQKAQARVKLQRDIHRMRMEAEHSYLQQPSVSQRPNPHVERQKAEQANKRSEDEWCKRYDAQREDERHTWIYDHYNF